jgi:mannose-6-phosphate isomerase class I
VCLDGTATITGISASCGFGAGEAVLLGDSDGPLRLSGQARLAVVRVGPPQRR